MVVAMKRKQHTAKAKCKIRTGDQVVVTSGREKGRTGEVRRLLQRGNSLRVVITGVNMVAKHFRPSQDGPGRVEQIEAPIHISNVAHIDPGSDNVPTRIGYAVKDGVKTRIAKKSGKVIAMPTPVATAGKKQAAKAKPKGKDKQ